MVTTPYIYIRCIVSMVSSFIAFTKVFAMPLAIDSGVMRSSNARCAYYWMARGHDADETEKLSTKHAFVCFAANAQSCRQNRHRRTSGSLYTGRPRTPNPYRTFFVMWRAMTLNFSRVMLPRFKAGLRYALMCGRIARFSIRSLPWPSSGDCRPLPPLT